MYNWRFGKVAIVLIIATISLAIFGVSKAAYNPQINYQGKLTNNSDAAVANGVYNMQFRLCSDSECATIFWTETRTSTNQVQVTNGLFSVLLGSVTAIGDLSFNQDLYLELQVSDNTTTTMETLLPRKKLGTVPSAFEAGKLGGKTEAQFGTLAENETVAGAWTFNNILSITANSASPALSILQSGAGTGISVGNGTATTTIYGSATSTFPYGATFATTGGNVGIGTTTPSAKLGILATTEQLRLNYDASNYTSFTVGSTGDLTITPANSAATTITNGLVVNSTSLVVNKATGYVGVGITNPSYPFQVSGTGDTISAVKTGTATGAAWQYFVNDTGPVAFMVGYGSTNTLFPSAGGFGSTNNMYIFSDSAVTSGGSHSISFLTGGYTSSTQTRMTVASTGYVGIGTTAPSTKLDVSVGALSGSDANALSLTATSQGAGDEVRLRFYNNVAPGYEEAYIGGAFQATAADGYLAFGTRNASSTAEKMRLDKDGNLGIDTTNPGKALEINSATGANLRLTYNDSNGSAANYTDFSVGSDGALTIAPANSATTTISNGLVVNSTSLVVNKSTGYVGIGTTGPGKALEINSATGADLRLTYGDTDGSATYYTDFSVSSAGYLGITPSGGFVGIGTTTPSAKLQIYSTSATESILQVSNTSTANIFLVKANGRVMINTSSYQGATEYKLVIDSGSLTGNGLGVYGIIKASSLITGSSSLDIAETYPINSKCYADGNCPEKGDLVCNDSSLTSGVKKCSNLYDNTVIGIVSTNPGLLLGGSDFGNLEDNTSMRKVALAGRVPTKVSAVNGAIQIGDKLTSSDIPGVAMKATTEGSVVGIAMENYSDVSIGTITVFVNIGWNNTIYRALSVNNTNHVLKIGDEQNLYSMNLNGNFSIENNHIKVMTMNSDGTMQISGGTSDNLSLSSITDTSTGIYFGAQSSIGLVANGAVAMMINSSGTVSIGSIKASNFIAGHDGIAQNFEMTPDCQANNNCPVVNDIVCVASTTATSTYVEKCLGENMDKVVGVVSETNGLLLGDIVSSTSSTVSVSFFGRALVNVNNKNGIIKKGEVITVGDMFGIGERAIAPGNVIGVALTDSLGLSEEKLLVNLNIRWSLGNMTMIDIEAPTEMVSTTTSAPTILDSFSQAIKNSLEKLGLAIKDGIAKVKEIFADKVTTNSLCVGSTCVDEDQLKGLLQGATAQTGTTVAPSGSPEIVPADILSETPTTTVNSETTTPEIIPPPTETPTTTTP